MNIFQKERPGRKAVLLDQKKLSKIYFCDAVMANCALTSFCQEIDMTEALGLCAMMTKRARKE